MEEGIEDTIVPAATADGADAVPGGEAIADDVNLDASSTPDDTPPVETPPVDEAMVELDGEQYTAAQIQEALHISKNQSNFTAKNQAEAERLGMMAKVIEESRQGLINPNVNTPMAETSSIKTAQDFQNALLSEDPSEAMALLANFIQDTVSTQTSENDAKSAFMTAHPDYPQVISSPEYKTFMAQNPMGQYLNDVTGFYEFKASTTGNAVEDAKTNGFKEGEKNAAANANAKANLRVLNSGGGVTPPAKPQITPSTSHGDVLNAATAFLNSQRQNQ